MHANQMVKFTWEQFTKQGNMSTHFSGHFYSSSAIYVGENVLRNRDKGILKPFTTMEVPMN